MVSRVMLLAIFIVGMSCIHQGYSAAEWMKVNDHPVCFNSKGDKPGDVRNDGRSLLVAGVKLVYRSGSIRCAHSDAYESRWGCYNYPGLQQTPLNVIVADEYKHRIFPLDKYITKNGFLPGLWYYMPNVHTKHSNEVVFTNFKDPFYFKHNSRLYIWYGEDLTNWAEADNFGRVCVDVYIHAML